MQKRHTTKDLSQKQLKKLLHYNPETGVWVWKIKNSNRIKIGDSAGCIDKETKYRHIMINKKLYRSSRLAFLYMLGYFPEHESEHKNRIRDDDSWGNLREATRICNLRNKGIQTNNTSGIVGVGWNKMRKKWISRITINQKMIYLGRFTNKIDAVKARWNAEIIFDFTSCCTISSTFLYLKNRGIA